MKRPWRVDYRTPVMPAGYWSFVTTRSTEDRARTYVANQQGTFAAGYQYRLVDIRTGEVLAHFGGDR